MSSETIAPSKSTLQGQYAGFVSRLIAILVDMLLVMVALIAIGLTVELLLSFFRLDDVIANAIMSMSAASPTAQTLFRGLAAMGSFYFIFFLYYITMHSVTAGMTIGKSLMGLRVVRMDGMPLSVGRCTRRYVTFILAALPLLLGLLWVIIDDRRQGLHDKMSNTCVIYDWPAQEDETFLFKLRNRVRYAQQTRSRSGADSNSEASADPEASADETVT